MSTDPQPTDPQSTDTPGADEGQAAPVDPVQEGAPATGPEAPVPPVAPLPDDEE